jgi:hypothetical protein
MAPFASILIICNINVKNTALINDLMTTTAKFRLQLSIYRFALWIMYITTLYVEYENSTVREFLNLLAFLHWFKLTYYVGNDNNVHNI